jgi:hypothetical protein
MDGDCLYRMKSDGFRKIVKYLPVTVTVLFRVQRSFQSYALKGIENVDVKSVPRA